MTTIRYDTLGAGIECGRIELYFDDFLPPPPTPLPQASPNCFWLSNRLQLFIPIGDGDDDFLNRLMILCDPVTENPIPYSSDAVITFLNGMTRSKIPGKNYHVKKDVMSEQIAQMHELHSDAMCKYGLVPAEVQSPLGLEDLVQEKKVVGMFKKALGSATWIKRVSWFNLIRNRMEVSLRNNATWLSYSASGVQGVDDDEEEGPAGGSRLPEFHD